MSLTLSNLKPAAGSQKKRQRVGRGNASGRGNYSTRGMKGQRSRSGGKSGLKKLGFKMTLQRIPKKKGFKSRHANYTPINLKDLEINFKDGDVVTIPSLIKKGLVSPKEKKLVKILGNGSITKKLTVQASSFSTTASQAILKAGGKVEIITKRIERKKRKIAQARIPR